MGFRVDFVGGLYRRVFSDRCAEELLAWGVGQGSWHVAAGERRAVSPSWFSISRLARSSQCVEDGRREGFTEKGIARAIAARELLETIPLGVRLGVSPFPELHFELLRFVQEGGREALQVLRAHPGYAFVLASRELFAPGPVFSTNAVLRMKRTMVLGCLGLPGRGEFLTMLGKMPALSLRVGRVRELARVYRAGDSLVVNWLRHVSRINAGVIGVLSGERYRYATFGLLVEVGQERDEDDHDRTARLLDEVIERGRKYKPSWSPVFSTRAALAGAADRLREALCRGLSLDALFPDIGLPDEAVIGAVRLSRVVRPRDLVAVGVEHDLCAGNTWHQMKAAQGISAYYRVQHSGGSALCEITREHGRLVLTELRGPHNKTVPEAVWETVRTWLGTTANAVPGKDLVDVVIDPPF